MNYYANKITINHQPGLTDEQLIKCFINSDTGAMETLTELYKDRIYASILGMINDKNNASAIFRDVFIKIIDNMMGGKAVEEGKFLPWAMSIAHGLCIEHNQEIVKLKIANLLTDADSRGDQVLVSEIIMNGEIAESHNKIRSMIELLPEQQRKVILLNHYGGLNFKEIAELTKCSLTNALETMRFGLRSLQKMMKETAFRC